MDTETMLMLDKHMVLIEQSQIVTALLIERAKDMQAQIDRLEAELKRK